MYLKVLCLVLAGVVSTVNALDSPNFVFSYPKRKTWFDAVSACRELHPVKSYDLATIITDDDQKEVEELFATKKTAKKFRTWKDQIWIGGIATFGTTNFNWVSTGKSISTGFKKWDNDEPNNKNKNEYCIALRNRNGTELVWNDSDCDKSYYYMCKIKDKLKFTIDDIEVL